MKQQKLLAVLLCAATPLSYAATETLDEVVVTATRIPQPLNQSLSSTTVITQEDIRNSQAADLVTILRNVAGVEIDQSGGMGKTTSLFIRGTNSTHALVLLDGARIGSATSGTTSIQDLMLDQIERIEIVRGNASSLYGSDAIGGVIQIFTRRGHGTPAFNVSAGAGSKRTQRFSAGYGGIIDDTDFSVQFSTFKTDGVSAQNPALVSNVNPDHDGYRNSSLTASAGHALNANHHLSATLFGSVGNNEYDNSYNSNQADTNNNREQIWKFSLASDNQISDMWHSKIQLANGVDQYRDYTNGQPTAYFGSPSSLFQTSNRQLSWQNTLYIAEDKQFLLGVETLRQHISSDINPGYVQNMRRVNSLYAGYIGRYGAHQTQLNLRRDSNSQYGSATASLLGYGYAFSDVWRASANYGTAFRAPTFSELYYPGGGNSLLKPERSRNVEAGLHYFAKGDQQLDLVYFDNRIRNMISGWPPVNVNNVRINGLELSYVAQFNHTTVKASLTSQNPRDSETGEPLIRRSKKYSNVSLAHQFSSWQIGCEWQHSDSRPDTNMTTYQPVTLPSYNVFNLSAGYTISKQLKLLLRADNLTDQNNATAYAYNPVGRTVFASVSFQQ